MRRRRIPIAVLLVAALSACSGSSTEPDAETTSPPNTISTTSPPSSTTTIPPTTVPATTIPQTTTTVDRSVITSGSFAVPFTMRLPEGAVLVPGHADASYRDWSSGDNGLVITTMGPETVEEWSSYLSGNGIVGETVDTTLGTAETQYLDVSIEESIVMFGTGVIPATIMEAGDAMRVYVAQVDGEPVNLVLMSGGDDFEAWVDRAEEILSSLEWG